MLTVSYVSFIVSYHMASIMLYRWDVELQDPSEDKSESKSKKARQQLNKSLSAVKAAPVITVTPNK
jgi:hypothetical protein